MKHLAFLGFATALCGCQERLSQGPSALAQLDGQAYAQASCGSCHSTGRGSTSSPNPQAPPFASIANRDGLTRETLNAWLRDAHNYPDEMQFQLDDKRVKEIVNYMLTLRDPTYEPVG